MMLDTCAINLGTLKIMSEHFPSCLVSPLTLSQRPTWSIDGNLDFSMNGLHGRRLQVQRGEGGTRLNVPDCGPSVEALGGSPG